METACTKPEKTPFRQDPIIKRESRHEIPPSAEKLLASYISL